jgi:hypothetical protein
VLRGSDPEVAELRGSDPEVSDTWMWYADIVLALGAAVVNLPIREAVARGRAMRSGRDRVVAQPVSVRDDCLQRQGR